LPALPAEFEAVLAAGLPLAAGEVLPPAAMSGIDAHVRLLLAWNAAINLSGIREPAAIAREHVLDSLAALPMLRRAGIDEFVDLGSGAGFPGLPLAVGLPCRRALLVESTAKKARFLSVAAEAAGLAGRVEVAALRAEAVAADPRHRGRWQGVVSRAMADLAELSELALPLLARGGLLIAWKRRPFDEELARGRSAAAALGARILAVEAVAVPGLEDHVLVVTEKAGPTPSQYPRDPAARRRKPLGA
jgi:16S rRNA (guanine527-N7)-methyltransferase